MAKLFSTQPLKGMLDDFPENMAQYRWMREKIDNVAASYHYLEYDAPLLEPLDIFASKSSEELIKKQSYTFTDKGERQVILRPEITPSLARMAARMLKEKPKPFRWYSLPKCYRYERPQKGRLREFRQLNVDLIGDDSVLSDLEMMSFILELMRRFEVPKEAFEIKVNHRGVVSALLEERRFGDGEKKMFLQLIDRKEKLPPEIFSKQVKEAFSSQEKAAFLHDFLSINDPWLLFRDKKNAPLSRFKHFLKLSEETELKDTVVFVPSVVRGLDYYTGLVFEVFAKKGDFKRALFGGGRYDHLTALYSKEAVSGIGFGMGIYIFSLFLEQLSLLKVEKKNDPTCLVGIFSEDLYPLAHRVAGKLRATGYVVETALISGGVKKFFQKAEIRATKNLVVLGENELKKNGFELKRLEDGEVIGFSLDDV